MEFQPKTEEEVTAEQLCPKGKQPFTVMEAWVVVSKSAQNAGKDMLKLKLNVHGDDGYDYHVFDYVAPWFMAHKFRHFFYSVGRGDVYELGKIPDARDFIGCEGFCDIGIQEAKGDYKAKNTIKDYIPPMKNAASKPAVQATKAEDDDIPF